MSEVSSPISSSTEREDVSYKQYVVNLRDKGHEPHLIELTNFLEQTKPPPDCVPSTVMIYDIQPNWQYKPRQFKFHDGVTQTDLVNPEPSLAPLKAALDQDPPENGYRLICVSHLFPEIACYLGIKYDISADFFHRHMPGTEAVSGKLPSANSSQYSTQFEFDELYEADKRFQDYWPQLNDKYGWQIINIAVNRGAYFNLAYDYRPMDDSTFSRCHELMNKLSGAGSRPEPRNYFRFYIHQRASVFIDEPGDPRTAIVIFYPKIPVHQEDGDLRLVSRTSSWPDSSPLILPPRSRKGSIFYEEPEELQFHGIPTPSPSPTKDGVAQRDTDLAITYCEYLKEHLRHHQRRGTVGNKDNLENNFSHVFGIPLFLVIAEQWARVIQRRSFDLSLLEYKPTNYVDQETVHDINSHRLAIARNCEQLDSTFGEVKSLIAEMKTSEVASSWVSEWQVQNEATAERESEPHRLQRAVLEMMKAQREITRLHRSGSLTPPKRTALQDKPIPSMCWESILDDFKKLRLEMKAIQARSDRIKDSMLALIQIRDAEQSINQNQSLGYLTIIAFALLPVELMASIYGASLQEMTDHTIKRFSLDSVFVFVVLGGIVFAASLWFSTSKLRKTCKEYLKYNRVILKAWTVLFKLKKLLGKALDGPEKAPANDAESGQRT